MSIMDFLSKQFIDVIQWTEEESGVLSYHYPMLDQEIRNGAQLIVRPTQLAVFFNEGKFADKFGPGTHTLNTQTLPVLTYLKNWDKFFESPFKSDVYFFTFREQIDQKWGTTQPIAIREKEFGMIRLRAFGNYSYVVDNIETFWTKLCGTADKYTVADAEGQLRTAILTSLSALLGNSDLPFLDMAANQELLSQKLKEAVAPVFKNYGLELRSLYVANISLPEEIEKHLDRASSMRVIGDLQKYSQFQTAEAITEAASNPNSDAGAGVGLGAGIAMGQTMMENLKPNQQNPQQAAPASVVEDPIQTIEKLGELMKKGVLTQAEFDAKKAELLSRIK